MKAQRIFVGLLVCLLVGCTSLSSASDGRWKTAIEGAEKTSRNVHTVLVYEGGVELAHLYRPGWDQALSRGNSVLSWWTAHSSASVHDIRSTTKSIVALLAGPVLARHPKYSLETTVAQFPQWASQVSGPGQAVTLGDLLGMTAGLQWSEWGKPWWASDETALIWDSSPVASVLNHRTDGSRGQVFRYSGGNIQVAARMLEAIDGRSIEEIAQHDLWEPLGIRSASWGKTSDGKALAFAGLGLTAEDLAKVGQMILQKGEFQGRRVLSPEWLNQVLTPRVKVDTGLFDMAPSGTFYGLGWWLGSVTVGNRQYSWVSTVGNGGQRLFVIPDLQLIVVLFAGDYGDPSIQVWETQWLNQALETRYR